MIHSPESSRGFTLVEMLVALAVTSMLLLTFMNFSANSLIETSLIGAKSDLLGEAQQAMDVIGRDIRFSSNADDNNRIADPYAPDAATSPYSWESDSTTLVLATSAVTAHNKVIFDDPMHYYTLKNNHIYFVRNGSLYKRTLAADHAENAATTTCPEAAVSETCPEDRKLIADNVRTFTVRYVKSDGTAASISSEARSIELTINLRAKRYGRQVDANYKTQMVFRNE